MCIRDRYQSIQPYRGTCSGNRRKPGFRKLLRIPYSGNKNRCMFHTTKVFLNKICNLFLAEHPRRMLLYKDISDHRSFQSSRSSMVQFIAVSYTHLDVYKRQLQKAVILLMISIRSIRSLKHIIRRLQPDLS